MRGWPPPRDEAFLEIELLDRQCPKTGDAVPRYEAVVKLPGMPLNKRFIRKVPKLSAPDNHQPTPASGAYLDPLARLEKIWKLECDLSKPEPSEPAPEPLNQPPDGTNGEFEQKSEPKFTSLDLTRQQAIDLIQKRRSSRNQTQIIERLWDCKKGGSDAWKRAYAQFKDLVGESGK